MSRKTTLMRAALLCAVAALLCAAGCSAGQGGGEPNVPVTVEIDAEGWGADSSAFIAHIEGCCANTEGIDEYHAVYPDGTGSTFDAVPGRYHVTLIPGVNPDGTSYRTGHVRTVVFGSETREEHAKAKAEREGIGYEEALAEMDESEAEDRADTGFDTEWVGQSLSYSFSSAQQGVGDEAALADDAVASGDVPAEVAEKARYNLWHDMIENMPEMPEQTH